MLQLPATVPSLGPACLSRVHMAAARTVWFSFHLGCRRSSLLNISPLTQRIALMWGIRPLLQFPHPPRAGPVLLTLLFFPPSSIFLPSFAWFYTPVCSQLVFCMHSCVWRCIPDVSMERCTPHPPTPLLSSANLFLIRLWCAMKSGLSRQPGMTSSVVVPRRSPKALPKAKLAPEKVMFTVCWSAASLVHYSFLNSGETMTSEK